MGDVTCVTENKDLGVHTEDEARYELSWVVDTGVAEPVWVDWVGGVAVVDVAVGVFGFDTTEYCSSSSGSSSTNSEHTMFEC